jgi:hypothetical protein
MNDELPPQDPVAVRRRPLEQRLAHRPELLERLHQIADVLDQSGGDESTADDAEARVTLQLRQLGQELLGQWAREANAHTQAQVPTRHPAAVRHGKKNS